MRHTARVYLQFAAEANRWDDSKVAYLKPLSMTRKRPKPKVGVVVVAIDVQIPDEAFVGYRATVEL